MYAAKCWGNHLPKEFPKYLPPVMSKEITKKSAEEQKVIWFVKEREVPIQMVDIWEAGF